MRSNSPLVCSDFFGWTGDCETYVVSALVPRLLYQHVSAIDAGALDALVQTVMVANGRYCCKSLFALLIKILWALDAILE
jgi:hypothetical protein